METQSLKGKAAVVTGSTSGIGLGVARVLASQGADILLNGFGDKAQIDKLVAELKAQYRVKVGYSAADMSKPGDVAGMVAQATRELGQVDILVNNAGIQHTAPIEEFPVEKWDAVIAINLSAAFHAIRAALPQMKSRNWGRIINIASAHGLVASTQKVAYVAAKHGLLGMTKVVARNRDDRDHLQRDLPGLGADAARPEADRRPCGERKDSVERAKMELLSEKQPSLEFATPEQIGAATLFLCSEGAAQIRGIALPVDGGWTAQ